MAEEKKSKVIGPQFERKEPRGKKKVVQKHPEERDDTVCVALNHPLGIQYEMPDGRIVVLNGNATHLVGKEAGTLPIGAFGLTVIKEEDWNYIIEHFGKQKIFTNGLCFATRKKADSMEEAENRDDLRNGFEPIDVDKTATKPDKKD